MMQFFFFDIFFIKQKKILKVILALTNFNSPHLSILTANEKFFSSSFFRSPLLASRHEARLPSEPDSVGRGTGPTMRCREERVIRQRQSDAAVDAKRSDDAIWMRAGAFRKVVAGRFARSFFPRGKIGRAFLPFCVKRDNCVKECTAK